MATANAPRGCVVRLGSAAPHLSQIAAGFALLHQQRALRVRFGGVSLPSGTYPHDRVLLAEFDGGPALLYDLADGGADIPWEALDACMENVKNCFKRSFDPADHQGMRNWTKIKPLGLNYHVTCRGSFFPKPGYAVPTAEDYMSHNSYPAYRGLFITELLEETSNENKRLNELRAQCLQACKEALGEQFYGGLIPTQKAKQLAPELILKNMSRAKYLRLLKENFVCVNAEGPQRSLGWGMAECAAAGRAIICPPPRYHVPGGFSKGRNYGIYETPEECARILRQALETVAWVHRMEAANFAYYQKYVMPDALVKQSLAGIIDN